MQNNGANDVFETIYLKTINSISRLDIKFSKMDFDILRQSKCRKNASKIII